MRYFDCFTFFQEFELLKIRCEELKELDVTHVLCEAPFTHQGDPKPLYFAEQKHLFKDYNIVHLIDQSMPNNGDAWKNENHQRDTLLYGLTECEDDDIVGIFDADEIPKASMVKKYEKEMGIVGVKQDKFSYYLNCVEGYQQWEVGRLLTWGMLKQSTPNKVRNSPFHTVMCEAGWHFSFMGGVDKMLQKFFAYAHTESLKEDVIDPDKLRSKYERGESLWSKDYWRFVEIDETFPKYLYENQEEFKSLIKEI